MIEIGPRALPARELSSAEGFAAKTTKASFRATNGSPFDWTPKPFSPRR